MTDSSTPSKLANGGVSSNQQLPNGSSTRTSDNLGGKSQTAPRDSKEKQEMSGAEKKKQQKAEKAARRAQEKQSRTGAEAASSQTSSQIRRQSQGADTRPESSQQARSAQHKRAGSIGSTNLPQKTVPFRRRPSQSVGKDSTSEKKKRVAFFEHLYGHPRRKSLEGTAKEVHPAIASLALQFSSYTICGSHARCVAMMLALKSVIQSYATPHGTSLPRHLSSHFLSPQLSHLKSARPFSVTQSNAIRWLKNYIANIDPSALEDDAKKEICGAVDTFIRDRFTIADRVIADATADRIKDGDVIVTFGKSAVVTLAIATAIQRGTKFRMICVDGRPLREGKYLVQSLAPLQIDVTYTYTGGLPQAIQSATKCILGAHAILGNGRIHSRIGTASVAMMAKQQQIPVIVCAETAKFTERIALDSIVTNELAPEEELIEQDTEESGQKQMDTFKEYGSKKNESKPAKAKGQVQKSDPKDSKTAEPLPDILSQWRANENLQLLNILYDVTPENYIDLIITEMGSIPASSAPVLQRLSTGV